MRVEHGRVHEERSPLRASRVGERLRSAREETGTSLEEVAARTRVPIRHLVAIEEGDFASLPASAYSAGFVRAYAAVLGPGALGVDAADLGREFRAEVDRAGDKVARPELRPFEPADPSRLPPGSLAIVAALIALLLVVGYGIWRASADGGSAADRARLAVSAEDTPLPAAVAPAVPQPAPAAPAASHAPPTRAAAFTPLASPSRSRRHARHRRRSRGQDATPSPATAATVAPAIQTAPPPPGNGA